MATMPTYDYESEQDQLLRRQKVMEAMQMGGLSPLEMPTQPGVKVSPLAPIAKILQAYAGAQGVKSIGNERQQLSQRFQADGRQGLERLLEGMSQQPGVQPAQGLPDGGAGANNPSAYVGQSTQNPEEAAGKRRAAIMEAMMSNHPRVAEMGKAAYGSLGKGQVEAKDLLPYIDPKAIPQLLQQGNGAFQPKPSIHAAGDRLWDTNKPGAPVIDAREQFSPVGPVAMGPDGKPIIGQTAAGTGKASFAPQGTRVEVNTGDKASTELGKKVADQQAKQLGESFTKAKELPQAMSSLDEASNALKSGIKSGQMADVSLVLAKISEDLGLGKTDPTIASSEQFRAKMAESVLGIIKTLRPASDKDVEYAKQAAGADLKLSAAALEKLINSARATGYNTYLEHMHLVDRIEKTQGALPDQLETFRFPMSINADADTFDFKGGRFALKPQAVASGTPAVPMSLDDYLKRKGAK